MYDFSIKLKQEPKLNYGQIVYTIETFGGENFNTPCDICNDTGKIQISGFEFDCPRCHDDRYTTYNNIYICEYTLHKLIVNGITFTGKESKYEYELDTSQQDIQIHYNMFEKDNMGIIDRFAMLDSDILVDVYPDGITDINNRDKVFLFTDMSKATEALNILIDDDKKRLEKFNKRFGTHHKYPFETNIKI